MRPGVQRSPRQLQRDDDRASFSSGADELDTRLRKYAWQNQRANSAITNVTTLDGVVVGYSAICAAGLSRDHVPPEFGKHQPTDIPCVLLTPLAVDTHVQGHGVGWNLFRDAIGRSVQVASTLGAACLLIHCRDEQARDSSLHHTDLLPSPVDPLHLIPPMKRAAGPLDG